MNDPFAAIRARFVARAAEDLELLRARPLTDEAVRHAVHRLAGTAGTLGFADLSQLAAAVDEALHEGRTPEPAAVDDLQAALAALVTPRG